MAKAEKITFKYFREHFSTEEKCHNYLFKERFPNGFICPKCGHQECYYLRSRNKCQCKHCRHQTSVTAGTVMHRTHLPLTVWFWAIYLCATDKRGISAKGLARQLELSYESAWYLLTRIRSAMHDRDQNYMLEGIIEMDEAYLGAARGGKKRGRGTERKKMAVAVSKDDNGHPLFLKLQMIACNLGGKGGMVKSDFAAKRDKKILLPYFTQSGEDREENGDQYLANMKDGAWCGFKYFAFNGTERQITVSMCGTAAGTVKVYTDRNMLPVVSILIHPSKDWTEYTEKLNFPAGTAPLVFVYEGVGSLDFRYFTIK